MLNEPPAKRTDAKFSATQNVVRREKGYNNLGAIGYKQSSTEAKLCSKQQLYINVYLHRLVEIHISSQHLLAPAPDPLSLPKGRAPNSPQRKI
jgi:hypothetical protein